MCSSELNEQCAASSSGAAKGLLSRPIALLDALSRFDGRRGVWSWPYHVHEHPQRILATALGRELRRDLAVTEYRVVSRLRQALTEANAEATLHGSPHELVPGLTEKLGVHTLFMGSVGRGDVPGLFVGDLAEQLVLRVRPLPASSRPASPLRSCFEIPRAALRRPCESAYGCSAARCDVIE